MSSDNRGILSVNLLKNGIGVDHADYFVGILKDHPTLKSLCGNNSNETELDMGGKMHGVGDAIMLIAEVVDNGALTTLILKDNKLLTPEAGKVLSDMLAANTVLKELDVSSNNWEELRRMKGDGPGFAKELAVGISGNGAMTSLDVRNNRLCAEGTTLLAEALKGNQIMTELSLSSNYVTDGGLSGVVALADAIPDMGAMAKLDMSRNYFQGPAAGKAIGDMLTGNSTLKDLDLSRCSIDSGAAKGISKGLAGNGALTSLDISDNNLTRHGSNMSGKPHEHVFGLLI
jgi:Ran GTPase-activating protein (RanGAP) involved in mRNA processing and transport